MPLTNLVSQICKCGFCFSRIDGICVKSRAPRYYIVYKLDWCRSYFSRCFAVLFVIAAYCFFGLRMVVLLWSEKRIYQKCCHKDIKEKLLPFKIYCCVLIRRNGCSSTYTVEYSGCLAFCPRNKTRCVLWCVLCRTSLVDIDPALLCTSCDIYAFEDNCNFYFCRTYFRTVHLRFFFEQK